VKTLLAILVLVVLLFSPARGETLEEGIQQVLDTLDVSELEQHLQQDDPFASTGGLVPTIRAIASGELTLDFQQVMAGIISRLFSEAKNSLWRLTRLLAPALIWSILRRLTGKSSEAGRAVCLLAICVFLTRDLTDHITLCRNTVSKVASGMQGLFPLLLTLMAAVGGHAASALVQPAVVTAAGTMTSLVENVTLPLALLCATVTMLCRLGSGIRLQHLASLLYQAAAWTLGLCFTVFIGVITTRCVTSAALDGVTLRTAKYALDNLIPVVGGLFADTVDTLVGAGMLVQGALGVTGVLLLGASCLAPLCQTFAAAMMYKLTAALLQPVSDGEPAGCIHDFSRVLMLLFIIQLCTAAMFILLIAQLIAVSGMTMKLR